MIFTLTTMILLISMVTLFRGNIAHDAIISATQYNIDKLDGKVANDELIIPSCLWFLFAIFFIPLRIVVLYYVLDIDTLHYPTLTMFAVTFLCFLKSIVTMKSTPKTDEQKRAKYVLDIANAKRRTFLGTLTSLLWTGYSLYLICVLLGGKL